MATTEEATQQIESPTLAARLSRWLQRDEAPASDEQGGTRTYWWEWAGYGLLLVIAAAMRLWDLGSRAVHHDESLHSYFSWELFDGRGFVHNPMMHGPFQFEANAAVFFIFGDSDYTSRLLYAVVGTLLVGLPFLFRDRLGKLGALLVSVMLVFSPALLYFSRFARNDILMAFWTLGLVICMWRYIDEGKTRYIYISAALLALAFATKETAYLVTALLGLYLFLLVIPEHLSRIREKIRISEDTRTPAAIGKVISGAWTYFRHDLKLSELNRPASFLLILITITLPQWSALVSIFQDTALLSWSNLTLANPEGVNPIGAPSGGGMVLAALVVLVMMGLSIYGGFKWNWTVWWPSAAVFYIIWTLLYTTFLTNPAGIGSGMWQGLGYWVAQQEVARGGQPWYYYLVITPLYEYLPLLFSVIAAVYYIRRREVFGLFLAFWAGMTLVLYTLASEKMPWLLVNVALPLIVLSGKFLADVIQRIEWPRLVRGGGLLLLAGVPLLLVVLWRLAFFDSNSGGAIVLIGLSVITLVLVVFGVYVARRTAVRNFAAFAAVPVAAILLALTVRTAWIASYQHGDIPVEMLVYTQTSPDITKLVREIEQASDATGQDTNMPITIDQTSGFTWPWAWYLRDYTSVNYPSYEGTPLQQQPGTPVVLVHANNQEEAEEVLQEAYTQAERIRHRWWFPESTYRDLSLSKILHGMVDRETWRKAMDYFLYREGVMDRVGSEDAYVYFENGLPVDISAP